MRRISATKTLGLSLLALAGFMAVSVSAAQAEWLYLLNETSVSAITFHIEVLPGEMLVPGLGLSINCTSGLGSLAASLSEANKKSSGSSEITFTGCKVLGSEKNCTVEGPSKETIVVKGSGTASMKAGSKNVTFSLSSSNFATIAISGALCPLSEVEGALNGSLELTLFDPGPEEVNHLGTLDEILLDYGEEPMTWHPSGIESGGMQVHLTDLTIRMPSGPSH